MLHHAFVHIPICHACHKISQILVRPSRVTLSDHRVDHGTSHALNRGKRITYLPARHRKTVFAYIDIRRQNLDAHASARHNILRHLTWIINNGSHQRRHKLHGMIIFHISRLVSHHRITCRM